MNRRALLAAIPLLAMVKPDPSYAEMISPDGRIMVRVSDRWHLKDEL